MDFSNSKDTNKLWEEMILPYWRHRERQTGKRFLGSMIIDQENANRLLNIVGANLRAHRSRGNRVSYLSLCRNFEASRNWIKILTVAFSEYAYYYSTSNTGFWRGFCDHELINIPYDQGTENTFREVVREGIEILGLVKARQGHTFVSTLWLQSGIPQRNLAHFAQLVQDIANECGWWELSHTSSKLLSQELLDFGQERYPLRNILINFLRVSCSYTENVEPISGQLVQGIATVALELERNKQSADILRDVNLRENLLRNYDLPKHFFLRDWDNLIQVLSHVESNNSNHHRIIKSRKKPLSLIFDIFDTGNIQLVLPEQNLKEASWANLLGSYCHILTLHRSSFIWDGNFPSPILDFLGIPERTTDIKSVENQWGFRLLSHDNRELVAWHYEGIIEALPFLVFDANLGTHISLDIANPLISKTDEVICFVPNNVSLNLNDGIDILNSYVPCSISGWYGQHIQLLSQQSEIHLTRSEQSLNKALAWQLSDNQKQVLRGLKIKGKKEIYLETPTFWHPPTSQNLNFTISVENLTNQEIIARQSVDILQSNRWQKISLEEMITTPSKYQVRFWNEAQRYSFSFELGSEYQISEASNTNTLQVSRGYVEIVESLPIQCNKSNKFWSEVINLQGLWTLEKVLIALSNGDCRTSCLVHADKSGSASISLSTLYGKLPQSDWYCLSYQRSGLGEQRLVELVATKPISYTWARQAIHLAGLQPDQSYSLICWNLLNPNQAPEKIRIENQGQDTIAVPLTLGVGIYQIQIQGLSLQDLGCWCGNDQNDLPDLSEEEEYLENYCYTILGNESIEDFVAASNNLGIDRQRIRLMVSSLQKSPYYFPEWLNQESLLGKLEAYINVLNPSVEVIPSPVVPPALPSNPPSQIISVEETPIGNWYLVETQPCRRDIVSTRLSLPYLHDTILELGIPQPSEYRDYILVRLNNYDQGFDCISRIDGFKTIQRRPLPVAQVNQMLGRE